MFDALRAVGLEEHVADCEAILPGVQEYWKRVNDQERERVQKRKLKSQEDGGGTGASSSSSSYDPAARAPPSKSSKTEESPRRAQHSSKRPQSEYAANTEQIKCPYCGEMVLPMGLGSHQRGTKCQRMKEEYMERARREYGE